MEEMATDSNSLLQICFQVEVQRGISMADAALALFRLDIMGCIHVWRDCIRGDVLTVQAEKFFMMLIENKKTASLEERSRQWRISSVAMEHMPILLKDYFPNLFCSTLATENEQLLLEDYSLKDITVLQRGKENTKLDY